MQKSGHSKWPIIAAVALVFFFFWVTQPQNHRQLLRADIESDHSKIHAALEKLGVDILSFTRERVEFFAADHQLALLKHILPTSVVLSRNFAVAVPPKRNRKVPNNNPDWFTEYHTYDEIHDWYVDLARKYPSRVQLLKIGRTYENRSLIAVRISNSTQKPQFYIQAGIHAREWVSPAVMQYLAWQLASSKNTEVASLLQNGEFVLVPLLNPDGYAYTWEKDRLWRKNRSPQPFSFGTVFGVDLNRNFDSNWGNGGSSSLPISDTYMGPSAASELEVKAVEGVFRKFRNITMALDLHSYSQLILRPIGWKRGNAPHEKQLRSVSASMARAIKAVNGKSYTAEKSIDLYLTTGSADDWFYQQSMVLHDREIVPYSLTIELRPSSSHFAPGFELPSDQIVPTAEEILPAVLFMAQTSLESPLERG